MTVPFGASPSVAIVQSVDRTRGLYPAQGLGIAPAARDRHFQISVSAMSGA
jgi:hypothetical protein